jgi:hypothetical protein
MAKKEPGEAAPKKLKLPKSLGACVDLYHTMRQKRLAANKDVEAMKAQETEVSNYIIDNVSKKEEGGAVGTTHKAIVVTDTIYQVEDWDKFYAHLKKTGEFDLLNRALNQAAVKARVEEQVRPSGKKGETWKPKLPPGVKTFNALKLSVTKK